MGGQGLNPLSLGGSDNVGAEERESSTTEESVISPGSFPSDYKEILYRLHQGDVYAASPSIITDKGAFYSGTSAVQDAYDAVNGGKATILVGNSVDNYTPDHYDPVVLDDPADIDIRGLGELSKIQGDTQHAMEINNANGSVLRTRIADLQLRTPSGGGNSVDCLHIDAQQSASDIFESWFVNIEFQEADRDAIHMLGQSGTPVTTLKFVAPFGEGIDRHAIFANQYVREISVMGATFNVSNDNSLINYDGSLFYLTADHLGKPAGVNEIELGANSKDCTLLIADKASVTDDGSRNSWRTANEFFHQDYGILSPAGSPYGPQIVGNDQGLSGNGKDTLIDGGTSGHAVDTTGQRAQVFNVAVSTDGGGGNNFDAINVSASSSVQGIVIANVYVEDSDRDGIRIGQNIQDSVISNVAIQQTDSQAIFCDGTRITISGVAPRNEGVTFGANSQECVYYGRVLNVIDNGTRNVINGKSTNSGDPSSTGQWNGQAALAHELGIIVYNTSTSPSDPYIADDGGNWIKIGS